MTDAPPAPATAASGAPSPGSRRDERGLGLAQGLAAYGLWGAMPLYFTVVAFVGPLDVVAQRVVWSLVFSALLLTVLRGWGRLRRLLADRRAMLMLGVAGVVVAANWLLFVYAVHSQRTLEASLGYFINPLVTVLLGVILLRERLSRLQWAAMGTGALAVVVLTIGYGSPPWISLALAFSFGLYGLIKKQVGPKAGAVEGLFAETLLLVPAAVAFLVWRAVDSGIPLLGNGIGEALLLIGLGPATALPLLAFAGASRRVPLSWMGMMQYLTPILQFLVGWQLLGEHMGSARWAGFAIIWVSVVLVITDALRRSRRRARREASSAVGSAGRSPRSPRAVSESSPRGRSRP